MSLTLEEKLIASFFQINIIQYSKHLPLHPEISHTSAPPPKKLFSYQIKAITGIQNLSKY